MTYEFSFTSAKYVNQPTLPGFKKPPLPLFTLHMERSSYNGTQIIYECSLSMYSCGTTSILVGDYLEFINSGSRKLTCQDAMRVLNGMIEPDPDGYLDPPIADFVDNYMYYLSAPKLTKDAS